MPRGGRRPPGHELIIPGEEAMTVNWGISIANSVPTAASAVKSSGLNSGQAVETSKLSTVGAEGIFRWSVKCVENRKEHQTAKAHCWGRPLTLIERKLGEGRKGIRYPRVLSPVNDGY
ncbi:hypothetical protein OSB04_un001587 [Centaurea solstitialis]|uniref:Uncharacterized protein n=1 Tax=Centaurea solstitialis TaxID=347529 RepID=A0AA38SFM3_9ASTR|nr:hypothetical protein OSB04_un001587 [Centaurea solstitialis]